MPLPPYITKFLECVYTIGNFIPVPLVPNFNTCRSGLCRDYWDLTLLAIYRHYEKNGEEKSEAWQELLSREGVRHWLDGYGSWDAFVEHNFLQDFVHKERVPYGKPKPLWRGHLDDEAKVMPKEDQFEDFFTTATNWITARGKKIAGALVEARRQTKGQESDAEEGAI